jgi:hypothetical protein
MALWESESGESEQWFETQACKTTWKIGLSLLVQIN